MVRAEQHANLRVDAGEAPADRLHLRLRAAHLIHVGGGAADVAHHPCERRIPAICSSSRSTDAWERDWMVRPWCAVMEQKVHPPKHPRMMVTESFTIS